MTMAIQPHGGGVSKKVIQAVRGSQQRMKYATMKPANGRLSKAYEDSRARRQSDVALELASLKKPELRQVHRCHTVAAFLGRH